MTSVQSIGEITDSTEENSLDDRIAIATVSDLIPETACLYCALDIRAVAYCHIDAVLAPEVVSDAQLTTHARTSSLTYHERRPEVIVD